MTLSLPSCFSHRELATTVVKLRLKNQYRHKHVEAVSSEHRLLFLVTRLGGGLQAKWSVFGLMFPMLRLGESSQDPVARRGAFLQALSVHTGLGCIFPAESHFVLNLASSPAVCQNPPER